MLADAGHRELVLVGINLAFYGKEFGLRLAADFGTQWGNQFGAMLTISKKGVITEW